MCDQGRIQGGANPAVPGAPFVDPRGSNLVMPPPLIRPYQLDVHELQHISYFLCVAFQFHCSVLSHCSIKHDDDDDDDDDDGDGHP